VFTLTCSLEFAHILVLVHDAEIVVQFFLSLRTFQHRRSQAAISLGEIVISADVFEASIFVDNMNTIFYLALNSGIHISGGSVEGFATPWLNAVHCTRMRQQLQCSPLCGAQRTKAT
jgi:hypothetical protein